MTNSSKRKGDRAELEVQGILRDHIGTSARRSLGAGRRDDVGDIAGVPDTVIQVADWKEVLRAVREKPLEAEEQRKRADVPFAATFVRLRGRENGVPCYRVVMTIPQWCAMWRETQ